MTNLTAATVNIHDMVIITDLPGSEAKAVVLDTNEIFIDAGIVNGHMAGLTVRHYWENLRHEIWGWNITTV